MNRQERHIAGLVVHGRCHPAAGIDHDLVGKLPGGILLVEQLQRAAFGVYGVGADPGGTRALFSCQFTA